jgi:hypothetical protein
MQLAGRNGYDEQSLKKRLIMANPYTRRIATG